MRAPFATTNSKQTVFSWLVAQETRLHRQLQQLRARRALRSAFARFAAGNPQLVDSLFDAYFVETRVAPLLARSLEAGLPLLPEAITAAWFAACRGPEASAAGFDLSSVTAAAAELLACLDEAQRPQAVAERPSEPPLGSADEMALFAEAVRADSNLELDWLWLAEQLRDEAQRRFCYEKALYINPDCEAARRALAAMATAPAPARELAIGEA